MFDFTRYAAVLLDLDGTIYHQDHALPGAAALLAALQRQQRPYACLSNSTTSPQRAAQRLARMGISIDAGHIFTAAVASADFVLERFGPRPAVLNLATEGVQELLDGRVHWVNGSAEPCQAIIVGTPVNTYATEDRQRMALHLARNGALIVATSADRIWPSPRGMEFGAGALAVMLGYAVNAAPVFVGKPQPVFFEKLCQHVGVNPSDCLLIGDNLESDIAGAKSVGMKAILTLTGVARREDLASIPPASHPDRVITDLRELL